MWFYFLLRKTPHDPEGASVLPCFRIWPGRKIVLMAPNSSFWAVVPIDEKSTPPYEYELGPTREIVTLMKHARLCET